MTVKIDRALIARARFVAEVRGKTLAAYLTDTLRPVVDTDFAAAVKESGALPL